MATKSTSCEKMAADIYAAKQLLDQWQLNLLNLRKATPPKYDEIQVARDTVEDLQTDLLRLKAQQLSMGCVPEESAGQFQDNQSVLQTGSVRRKDPRALEILIKETKTK